MSFCNVTIVGNVTRDPEFREVEGGMVEVKFAVATNWGRADKKESAFFEVSSRMSMDNYNKSYHMYQGAKGKKVTVVGELRPRKGQDNKGYAWLNVMFAKIELPYNENIQTPAQPQAEQQQEQTNGYEPVQPVYTPPAVAQSVVPTTQPPVPPVGFPARPPAAPRAQTGNALPPPPPFTGK